MEEEIPSVIASEIRRRKVRRREEQRTWDRAAGTEGETMAVRQGERRECRFGERMKNKPRGIGDKTAHWPRVRLTTLLVARPFFLASGQPGHFCPEHPESGIASSNHGTMERKKRERGGHKKRERERNIQTFLSRGPGKLNSTREIERGNSTHFEPTLRYAEFRPESEQHAPPTVTWAFVRGAMEISG